MTELWAINACPYMGVRTIFDYNSALKFSQNGQKVPLLPIEALLPVFGQTKKYFSYPNDR